MEPDWIGMAMVIGFVAIGTLVFIVAYKSLAAICRRLFPERFKEASESENVTPHDVTFALVGALSVFVPLAYLVTSVPSSEIDALMLLAWLGAIAVLVVGEKKLFASDKYKSSWWCSPIGKNSTGEMR